MDLTIPRLKFLKSKGFDPKFIYDIGAFRATWTSSIKTIFDQSTFILFEANGENQEFLKKSGHIFFIALLAEEDGKEKIFYSLPNGCTGDSTFKEQTHHYKDCKQTKRYSYKLSTLINKYGLKLPNFMKIDIQGSELDVLKGISIEHLKECEFIMLEVKVLEYNKGSPDMLEVLTFMKKLNYVLYDLLELHYVDNNLCEVDWLFCKENSKFLHKF